jgi:hypothetical protein
MFTIWIQYQLEQRSKRNGEAATAVREIKRNFYLLRMAYSTRYGAEVMCNYYEAMYKITQDKFFFDELYRLSLLLQPYSDRIYSIYSDLHANFSTLERSYSVEKIENVKEAFNIDNYQTLNISSFIDKAETKEQALECKDAAMKQVKAYTNEELKQQLQGCYNKINMLSEKKWDRTTIKWVVAGIALLWLLGMALGVRVLVYEHKVDPGHDYSVAEYGNLGNATQSSLVCKYFTGRNFVTSVYWYAPNNIMGRDTCPFVERP